MGKLAEIQRKLLEQMMGAEAMGFKSLKLHFTDQQVCRNFLCGVCPHDLFSNTKMDLGPCPKSHADKLKSEFLANQKANPTEFTPFFREYENNIRDFVNECDRRIRTAHKRLEKTPEENNKTTALMREVGEIQAAMDQAMIDVEKLGESGMVEESMKELQKVEALKEEKANKEQELTELTETSGASGHQKLRVCDICGAYLSILDSDRRLADHFGGKMHLGYFELRRIISEFNENRTLQRKKQQDEELEKSNAKPAPHEFDAHNNDDINISSSLYEENQPATGNGHLDPPPGHEIDPRAKRVDAREARREARYAESE
ncbi:hypothetical protein E3P99_03853 [Wallemia hederae]|uniref:Uncharacterized protein n=1 Tax=Wallemia hederae TaxID=1540922 RepID=A0A4T0FF50_9BASI|nr:hypothetical protein E3P99_03853 [Wallemia hederae]